MLSHKLPRYLYACEIIGMFLLEIIGDPTDTSKGVVQCKN